jgi:ADP-ribosylglycohydrolase
MGESDRVRGGLWGLLIGDAAGVPYEFKAPNALPGRAQLGPVPPAGFPRTYPQVPVGTWSDDGATALALLDSLLGCDALDLDDLGARLVRWLRHGDYAVGGEVFDVGIQTREALDRIAAGVPAERAGRSDERANGNGALMRVLPLALWHRGDDASLVADAARQGLPTHGHPRSQAACAVYALWARRLMTAPETPYEDAFSEVRGLLAEPLRAELEAHLAPDPPATPTGSGYVVDALHSARVALEEGSYEAVIQRAIAFGNDTDTTACIAGGLAGIRFGESGIPLAWRALMRDAPVVERLLARLGHPPLVDPSAGA